MASSQLIHSVDRLAVKIGVTRSAGIDHARHVRRLASSFLFFCSVVFLLLLSKIRTNPLFPRPLSLLPSSCAPSPVTFVHGLPDLYYTTAPLLQSNEKEKGSNK